ncbi:MAG: M23 family metallopeptidase [Bacteroidota bacterium]|nr:M23 family metallopeptidase [Bacteroidota bacterium]
MIKFLLIILLFKGTDSYAQLITISQKGRTIVTPEAHGNQRILGSRTQKIPGKNNEFDYIQTSKPKKEVDFRKESDLKSNKAVSLPLNGMQYVTSGFGERFHPVYHKEIFHEGIDLKADYKIVKTIANGIIAKEGYDKRAGNYLIIQHENRIESIYCHLSKFLCRPGDLVFAGNTIAISGATGAVTAPHLHFAIKENGKFIDPLPLLEAISRYFLIPEKLSYLKQCQK